MCEREREGEMKREKVRETKKERRKDLNLAIYFKEFHEISKC